MTVNSEFKRRLLARERLMGAFIKTPHPIVIEIMGGSGLDFLVLDGEHAPFERANIDTCMIAARAIGCPVVVRVPDNTQSTILAALDSGAAGVVVPHVNSVAQAEALAKSMHYVSGGRGFAGTTRAADYAKRKLPEHKAQARDEVCLFVQIEDMEGYAIRDQIAAVENVDALFIGRGDLAVDSGYDDFFAKEVGEMTDNILACKDAITGLYCAPGEPIDRWEKSGSSYFVIGSEHTLMTQGVNQMLADID